jgi:hypothetical protein
MKPMRREQQEDEARLAGAEDQKVGRGLERFGTVVIVGRFYVGAAKPCDVKGSV